MCVLGLCALIDLEQIPQVLNQVAGQILPAFILLFNGLKRAYACHAEHENDSDDDDEAEEDEETGMETEELLHFVFHDSWWRCRVLLWNYSEFPNLKTKLWCNAQSFNTFQVYVTYFPFPLKS